MAFYVLTPSYGFSEQQTGHDLRAPLKNIRSRVTFTARSIITNDTRCLRRVSSGTAQSARSGIRHLSIPGENPNRERGAGPAARALRGAPRLDGPEGPLPRLRQLFEHRHEMLDADHAPLGGAAIAAAHLHRGQPDLAPGTARQVRTALRQTENPPSIARCAAESARSSKSWDACRPILAEMAKGSTIDRPLPRTDPPSEVSSIPPTP